MEAHLSSRHRDTVGRIFSQPLSRNIEWREVVSLLEAIGTVGHEHDGKLEVIPPRSLITARATTVTVSGANRPNGDSSARPTLHASDERLVSGRPRTSGLSGRSASTVDPRRLRLD
jgi:hypothetical protein